MNAFISHWVRRASTKTRKSAFIVWRQWNIDLRFNSTSQRFLTIVLKKVNCMTKKTANLNTGYVNSLLYLFWNSSVSRCNSAKPLPVKLIVLRKHTSHLVSPQQRILKVTLRNIVNTAVLGFFWQFNLENCPRMGISKQLYFTWLFKRVWVDCSHDFRLFLLGGVTGRKHGIVSRTVAS